METILIETRPGSYMPEELIALEFEFSGSRVQEVQNRDTAVGGCCCSSSSGGGGK